ncbi:hypothetical protein Tco_0172707 [Tanacetum coccineum]
MEKAIKEAELSNPKIIKVAVKLVNEAKFQIARSKEFLKHQLAHLQVLSRAHSEKLKKKAELRKKRNNDPRNFKVHKEFKFSDFGISEWDRLGAILPNKSNKCVGEMMTSLRKEFMKNMVIEKPKHWLFFIDAFGEETFQRVSNIHKVETKTLLGYKVMALNVKTVENRRFMVLMSRMIDECLDKDKILTKRVK